MPKLIVLNYGAESSASVADAAAAGAKSIRFTEVDRGAGGTTVTGYDAIMFVAPAGMTTHDDLEPLLAELERDGRVTNTVFALIGGGTSFLERLSRTGGIIVTSGPAHDPTESARTLGARTAKVMGWVRHGLGHEAEHHHHHHH